MKVYITAIPEKKDDLEWGYLTRIARTLMSDEVQTRLVFTNMKRERVPEFVKASEL